MPDPRETLARILAQADAATEGPWDYRRGYDTPSEWQDSYVLDEDGESVVSDVSDGNGEFIAASRTNVPRLVDALDAVLDTHPRSPNTRAVGFPRADRDEYYCMEDQKSWPCPTVEAVTQALEGDTND